MVKGMGGGGGGRRGGPSSITLIEHNKGSIPNLYL